MARVILRWSINDEVSNQTGNRLKDMLLPMGFTMVGTASMENPDVSVEDASLFVQVAMRVLADPVEGILDHVWIYVDDGAEVLERKAAKAKKMAAKKMAAKKMAAKKMAAKKSSTGA